MTATQPPTLGILGGGQLARMIALAAYPLGCRVVILQRSHPNPADCLSTRTVTGDWDDPDSLLKLAGLVDVVTLENEFVEAESLAVLERHGHRLWPASETVRVVQDKLWQKQALVKAGLPVPRFVDAPNRDAVNVAAEQFGWPLVLKKRRNGYDGKGNYTLHSAADIEAAWRHLDGDANALYAEQFCPFEQELAVMITRAQDGSTVSYPVVETIQRNHICHIVKAPAAVSQEVAARATDIARRAVESVACVGSIGVELFLARNGGISVNEMAPRVHNSGHYTIEACECSQFENHVRAVLGWPLGSPTMRAPAAVMINLLAQADGPGEPNGMQEALRVAGAHVHIYGKTHSVAGRKMGHVTALGQTVEAALATARQAATAIGFGHQNHCPK